MVVNVHTLGRCLTKVSLTAGAIGGTSYCQTKTDEPPEHHLIPDVSKKLGTLSVALCRLGGVRYIFPFLFVRWSSSTLTFYRRLHFRIHDKMIIFLLLQLEHFWW